MSYLKISGIAVKTPQSFQVSIQDIDGNTSRNAQGNMNRDRVAIKRKLQVSWGPCSMAETSTILQAVSDVFIDVTYPDPQDGKIVTRTFYVGDRTAPTYSWNVKFAQFEWKGISFDFVEK
ncbi:DUF6711 family protein [Weissella koreensis]|uniref:DUF6711 family protein n=1 Tax=Weissella koreensis TaxID=165096 RepID=UPI000CF3506A|nr:DUF6711 family protein [Weissella koreensis]AVH74708.1 hypothetical protein C4597_01160 [Weissella koreensis]QGN19931.1 hypothetical protein GKC51_01130 [Weissella koreensis]